jgi:hypothetical protein
LPVEHEKADTSFDQPVVVTYGGGSAGPADE